MKIDSKDFLQLVESVVDLLSNEKERVGSLQIIGKLVKVPQIGEAIVIGDLHGDLKSLGYILENTNFIMRADEDENIFMIFLGDYGDRGFQSPEVYYIVLELKRLFPERVILMRGNHEGPDDLLAHPHDLPAHLKRKFSEGGSDIYLKLRELFNHLYNAVIIDERYILLHGGAPSQASTTDDIAYAHEKHPSESHLEEILWSDPIESVKGAYPSPRGAGRLFGEDVTKKLLKTFNVRALIRGHEPSEKGFKTNHSGKVLTIFSRKGPPYYNDHAAYLHINISKKIENMNQILKFLYAF